MVFGPACSTHGLIARALFLQYAAVLIFLFHVDFTQSLNSIQADDGDKQALPPGESKLNNNPQVLTNLPYTHTTIFPHVDQDTDSCRMNIDKNCKNDGSCSYNLKLPQIDIVGTFLKDLDNGLAESNSCTKNYAAISSQIEQYQTQQSIATEKSVDSASNLTKAFQRLEYSMEKSLTNLSNMIYTFKQTQFEEVETRVMTKLNLTFQNDGKNGDSASEQTHLSSIKQRLEVLEVLLKNQQKLSSQDFEYSATNNYESDINEANETITNFEHTSEMTDFGRTKSPTDQTIATTVSSRLHDYTTKDLTQEIVRSQMELRHRVSSLEQTLQNAIQGLEETLLNKIEQIFQPPLDHTTMTTETAEVPDFRINQTTILQSTQPTAINITSEKPENDNSSNVPRMMLCRTCCELALLSEYVESQGITLPSLEENDLDGLEDYQQFEYENESYKGLRYDREAATGREEIISIIRGRINNIYQSDADFETIDTMNGNTSIISVGNERNINAADHEVTEGLASNSNSKNIFRDTKKENIIKNTLTTTNTPTQIAQTINVWNGGNQAETNTDQNNTVTAIDCADLYIRGERQSTVHRIRVKNGDIWHVYCDMNTNGGGWTIIQRRINGEVNFTRNWKDYKDGFGHIYGDHWLGLDRMHLLTATNKSRRLSLRIDLTDWDDVIHYAQYDTFKIRSETRRYQLTARRYSGTAGDALNYGDNYNHDMQPFTTYDRDNDNYGTGNCGKYYRSGWWFNACFAANLNGRYYRGPYMGVQNGIYWGTWYKLSNPAHNIRYSFKKIEMKVRPVHFDRAKRSEED